MPYPNEHAARLKDPGAFKATPDWAKPGTGKFRRTKGGTLFARIKVPPTISIIWGQLKSQSGKQAAPQSLRFPTANWTAKAARKWLSDHKIKTVSFEPASGKVKAGAYLRAAIDCLASLFALSVPGSEADFIVAADLAGSTIYLTSGEAIDLKAAAETQGNGPKPFRGTAYTGGIMRPRNLEGRQVVVDLEGLEIDQALPALKNHDADQIVGHTNHIGAQGTVEVAGVISGTGAAAQEVLANARNGFPWQLSIGASIVQAIDVPRARSIQVNGRTFQGPVLVARKARLNEVSFVPRGADPQTSVSIAAAAASTDH